eukprot:6447128-Prymnesium_polylepis.1
MHALGCVGRQQQLVERAVAPARRRQLDFMKMQPPTLIAAIPRQLRALARYPPPVPLPVVLGAVLPPPRAIDGPTRHRIHKYRARVQLGVVTARKR